MNIVETNIFYITIILCASFMAYLYEKIGRENGKYKKILLFVSYLIISIPVGIRHYTGADYEQYVEIYNNIKYYGIINSYNLGIEPGYILLNYICEIIFSNYKSIFIVMAFVTNYFFYKAIINKSEYIKIGTAIFTYGFTLYFWGYIQIRNMLAISIIFYSFDFIFEKKLYKFFIAVTIASTFHYSATIFYLLGILYSEKLKNSRRYIAYTMIVLLPVISEALYIIMKYIANQVPKYNGYINQLGDIRITITSYVVLNFLPIIIFRLLYKRLKIVNINIDFYYSLYIISVLLLLFADSSPLIIRLVYSLWPSTIIMFGSLSKVIDNIKNKNSKYLFRTTMTMGLGIYGLIYILFYINQKINYLVPYKSIITNI